jgi:hypothetical protein
LLLIGSKDRFFVCRKTNTSRSAETYPFSAALLKIDPQLLNSDATDYVTKVGHSLIEFVGGLETSSY